MASVPDLIVPATESRPLNPGYTNLDSQGAFVGGFNVGSVAGLGKDIGNAAANIALKQQQENNERDASQMDIALRQRVRAISFGTADDPATGSKASPGYFSLQGEAAMAAQRDASKSLEDAYNDVVTNSAGSDRAKNLFARSAMVMIENEKDRYSAHAQEQRKVANQRTSQARLNEINDDVISRYNDPKALAQGMFQVTDEVHRQAAQNGDSTEVEKSRVQEEQSKLIVGAVTAALRSQDPTAGAAIYAANKQYVDGRDQPQLEQLITQSTIIETSQANADAIMAMRLPKEKALEMARQKYQGAAEDRTVAELKERYGETEAAVDRAYTMRQRAKADKLEAVPQEGLDAATSVLASDAGKTRDSARAAIIANVPDARVQASALNVIDERFDHLEHTQLKADQQATKERDQKAQAEVDNILGALGESADRTDAAEAAKENIDTSTPEGQALFDAVQARLDKHFDFNEQVEAHTYQKTQQAYQQQEQADRQALKEANKAASDWVNTQHKPLDEFLSTHPEEAAIIGSDQSSTNSLRLADDARARGELFAPVTDGKTLAGLRALPAIELADTDPELVRAQLTQTEYNQAVNYINGAKKSIEDAKHGNSAARGISFMENYAPKVFRGKNANSSETKTAQQQSAINEMTARVSSYIDTYGKEPADADLQKWAVELTTPISADPAGILNSFDNISAVAIEKMTPEQRAVARVSKDDIPPVTLKDITGTLKAAGIVNPADDLVEAVAGQFLIGDEDARARAKQLIDAAKRKQTQGTK